MCEGPVADVTAGALAEEAVLVARAVPKRRAEFLAGRVFARRCLSLLGQDAGPIGRRGDGTPDWPKGIVGSIAHGADYCAAAVARGADARGIGIDIEEGGRVDPSLVRRILLPEEIAHHLNGKGPAEQRRIATLLFSAKEAFYKCQYGITGARLSFHDATISLDMAEESFDVVLLKDAPPLPRGARFEGRFGFDAARVGTALVQR